MKYTNQFNLPQGLVDAILADDYDIGKADFSNSNLASPPQIKRLMSLYADEIVIDVSDKIWTLFGRGVHSVLQQTKIVLPDAPESVIKENRFYMNVAGYTISGQPDRYDPETGLLEDYKVTSVYKATKGDYTDWHYQANVYNLLLIANGYRPKKLMINAILRDYRSAEKKRYPDYPEHPFLVIPIEIYDPLDTLNYIIERIKLHNIASKLNTPEEIAKHVPCSDKERWADPDRYIVRKKDGTRAVPGGAFSTKEEAQNLLATKGDGYLVEHQPGRATRCEDGFCPVSKFCYQFGSTRPELILPDGTETVTHTINLVNDLFASTKTIDKADPLGDQKSVAMYVDLTPDKEDINKSIFDFLKDAEYPPIPKDESTISTDDIAKAIAAPTLSTSDIKKAISRDMVTTGEVKRDPITGLNQFYPLDILDEPSTDPNVHEPTDEEIANIGKEPKEDSPSGNDIKTDDGFDFESFLKGIS